MDTDQPIQLSDLMYSEVMGIIYFVTSNQFSFHNWTAYIYLEHLEIDDYILIRGRVEQLSRNPLEKKKTKNKINPKKFLHNLMLNKNSCSEKIALSHLENIMVHPVIIQHYVSKQKLIT